MKFLFTTGHSHEETEENSIRVQRDLVSSSLGDDSEVSEVTADPSEGLGKGHMAGLDVCQGGVRYRPREDNKGGFQCLHNK